MASRSNVVVLDYGFGNVRSAVRALERVGANVTLTADPKAAGNANGLVVPGVGAFAAVMEGLTSVRGEQIIERRLAGGLPVLGICVGMQVMFERGLEHGQDTPGLAQWPGTVERLKAPVVPHMGWNTIKVQGESKLFAGLESERFYFVHSYGVHEFPQGDFQKGRLHPPTVITSNYAHDFVAAVENGPLSATQFHPEKSGDAGCALLENWLRTL